MQRNHFKIKTQLYFNDLLFAIVMLIPLHSGRLPAQVSTMKTSILTSKSIISLDGEWLIEKDPLNIGKWLNKAYNMSSYRRILYHKSFGQKIVRELYLWNIPKNFLPIFWEF